MLHDASNFVARLSPPGKSAIACLGVAGPKAWDLVRAKFVRPNNRPLPETPAPHALYFGSLGDERADEVVLFVRRVEPTCVLEIDCHGGPEVVRFLESTLAATVVTADVWSKFLDGEDRAELLDVLSRCPTARTAGIALDQLNGAFDRAIAEVDGARLARLNQLVNVGEHLVRPWKVVLAGAPNVGKSSLVNAIAGYTRSIVTPTPGTTRDVVSTKIALDGWPIELFDTAGLRDTSDDLEAEGIARAAAARAGADLVVWVLDATIVPDRLPTSAEFAVVNKIDQPAAWDVSTIPIRVSALKNTGLDGWIAEIVRRLVPHAPSAGEAVPIGAAHRRRLAGLDAAQLLTR